MNFLKGHLQGGRFVSESGTTLPVANAPAASDGKPVIYGVRPEHFILDDTNGLPAEVEVVEPTGSETQVFAKFAGSAVVGVFRERVNAQPGQQIRVTPDPALVHLFDEQTGKLTSIGNTSTGGKTPRNFNIDPTGKFLLAENQNSGTIVVLKIDPATGKLTDTGKSVNVPSPVCVQFLVK